MILKTCVFRYNSSLHSQRDSLYWPGVNSLVLIFNFLSVYSNSLHSGVMLSECNGPGLRP